MHAQTVGKVLERRIANVPFDVTILTLMIWLNNKTALDLQVMMENKAKIGDDKLCSLHMQSACLFCKSWNELVCRKCVFFGTHIAHDLSNLQEIDEMNKRKQAINELELKISKTFNIFKRVKERCDRT